MPAHQRTSPPDALTVLSEGDVELRGRLPWSSNATFLATLRLEEVCMDAVYKPHAGERALWDFPGGLYRREVAAYELSRALAWDVVPETVLRADGPLGPGSFQRFVDADFSQHYFTLLEDESHHDALRVIAAFDLVANNADRKSGHCLLTRDGHIWGIDHGLCFHAEPKLRTVIWDFAGEDIPVHLREDLGRVAAAAPEALQGLLVPDELAALTRRASAAAARGVFPAPPPTHRAYPWPLV